MSTTDDPEDTPYVHQVLYTNDVTRMVATWVSGLFTIAEPERVRRALVYVLDNWQRHVDMFERMKGVAQQAEDRAKKPSPKGTGN